MIWCLYLSTAISLEVRGTMFLPLSQNFSELIPTVVLLFACATSFYFLALVSQKLPLALIYSSCAGLGVFSVAILSNLIYGQPLNWKIILGLLMITVGVTIVNFYKTF
ncbi:SMR family transporter [Gammaproteobacteria bacterium]|nr:SMR family transporter [Gammaproteobacteria bacterium]